MSDSTKRDGSSSRGDLNKKTEDVGNTDAVLPTKDDDGGSRSNLNKKTEDVGSTDAVLPTKDAKESKTADSVPHEKEAEESNIHVVKEEENQTFDGEKDENNEAGESSTPTVKPFVPPVEEDALPPDLPPLPQAQEDNGTDLTTDLAWRKERRHTFILSSAGKPVYSRYGSEEKLVTLFGVMQALVSFVQDSDDVIQAVYFGDRVLAFLVKGPIILVAVSSKKDSVKFLVNQLTYVYNQVVSVLTLTRVTRIFEQRHNYDLRRLLTGSERLIDHLLTFTEKHPEFLLDGVECLPLASSVRDSISNAIVSTCSKIKNLVFAILIAENKLITLIHLKKYALKPSDIHLIFNMVSTYESLKTAECWTPICLPNFDSSGYLHGHITYLTDDCEACLILLTVDADLFHELSEAKKRITEKLLKNQSIVAINNSLKSPIYMDSINVPTIRHFLYKCRKTTNILVPVTNPPLGDQEQLLHQYQMVHDTMRSGTTPSLKLVYQHFANDVMIGWITEKFELYVAMDSLVSKSVASDSIDRLLKWIIKEEDKLFLTNIPTF